MQLQAAHYFSADKFPPAPQPIWRGERYGHAKIRLGYLSGDFFNHATAFLMAELFETHDRSRFEVTAFSFGPAATDEMFQRLRPAFDRFLQREKTLPRGTVSGESVNLFAVLDESALSPATEAVLPTIRAHYRGTIIAATAYTAELAEAGDQEAGQDRDQQHLKKIAARQRAALKASSAGRSSQML